MNDQYCLIYGSTDENPGLFIIGVSKNQNMINGFREEYYHICKYGEVVDDGQYDKYAGDYEVNCYLGHYMTPVMITDFVDYLTGIYNKFTYISDIYDINLPNLKFTPKNESIVSEAADLLSSHLSAMVPIELSEVIDDSIYGEVLNIENCLEEFLSTYEHRPL